jgi:parallel beta-helix repeat protein
MINSQPVKSQPSETIYIRADGTVEGTDKIQRDGNVYTFTGAIDGSIIVNGSNIVLDGAGFILNGEITINGDKVTITNMRITSISDRAIEVHSSDNNIIGNKIIARYTGIMLRHSNNNVISGNLVDAEVARGIDLSGSSNNVFFNNNITARIIEGVYLDDSSYNTFSGNNITFVEVYQSSYNMFFGNNNYHGFSIRHSSNYNNITGNSIIDYNYLENTTMTSSGSISIERSVGNFVSSNTLVNSGGIFLEAASNNVLRNNSVSKAGVGVEVSGAPQPELSSFINDIDDSNRINGKPIYYLINKNDLSISPSTYTNPGYLALVNCTRITVQNFNFNTQGILLAWTTESRITNNSITEGYGDGVILCYASNNNITNNNINSNSGEGVVFSSSNQNIVSGNYITRNQNGIYLFYSSSNNTIAQNSIADQEIGVHFYMSSSNLIYNNNFVNNTKQVYDAYWDTRGQPFSYILPSKNIWDNGYPIGGNYWSNYTDEYPNAKELEGSGIWDTPYVLDENNQDKYPLMEPVVIPEFPDEENSTLPPTEPPPSQQPGFLGTSLPVEYGYAILAVIVVIAGAAAFLVYVRKIRKTHGKAEKTMPEAVT